MNITIFAATNRIHSRASLFATFVEQLFHEQRIQTSLIDLSAIRADYIHPEMFEEDKVDRQIKDICKKSIMPADKFYFIIPEYNGSFPGVLKTFVDACSVFPEFGGFKNKKAALLGISSGRAGNLRGMDHFSAILNYISVTVMPNKQPVSSVENLLDARLAITDESTIKAIEQHVQELIHF